MSLIANRSKIALLLVDMQNDFLHPDGAYSRAGQSSQAIAAIQPRLVEVAGAMRDAGGWIVSTQFTLVPGKAGAPMIPPHLKKLRPFLTRGDFAPGSFGHQLISELSPADLSVEKVAYSAFYMTRLEWVLRKAGIKQLVIGGIVTNGGVASTLRGAHVRDFSTVLLSDGTAAFNEDVHNAAVSSLSAISPVATCAQICDALRGGNIRTPGLGCQTDSGFRAESPAE